jgi:hypothetical protein
MPDVSPLSRSVRPFGHSSAEDDELLKEAFHHVPYTDAATDQETTILVGRRGAGKTALALYLKESRPDLYKINLDIDKKKALAEVLLSIDRALKDSKSVTSDLMADLWTFLIWIKAVRRLLEHPAFQEFDGAADLRLAMQLLGVGDNSEALTSVRQLFDRSAPANGGNGDFAHFLVAVSSALESYEFREIQTQVSRFLDAGNDILVVIDTIEDYRVRDQNVDQALAGLLTAVAAFGGAKPHSRFHLKCFFPAEIYPYITTARAVNLRKVDQRLKNLRWTSRQLLVMLCRRLATWLESHVPERFGGISDRIDWNNHSIVRERVWNKVFPPYLINRRGITEDSFWYIARHTHLHPGQLIWMCNRIAQIAKDNGHFPPAIQPSDILRGVRSIETEIANSIMSPYGAIYPDVQKVIVAAFRQAPMVMPVSDALKLYRKAAQVWPKEYFPLDDWTLIQWAAEVGVIGKVKRTTAQYYIAQFRYHIDSELILEKDDTCALHPAFYHLLEASGDPKDHRTVCPVVVADDDDE